MVLEVTGENPIIVHHTTEVKELEILSEKKLDDAFKSLSEISTHLNSGNLKEHSLSHIYHNLKEISSFCKSMDTYQMKANRQSPFQKPKELPPNTKLKCQERKSLVRTTKSKKRKKDENTLQVPSIDKCKSITKELMETPILTLVNQESCEDNPPAKSNESNPNILHNSTPFPMDSLKRDSVSQNWHGDEIIIIDDSSGNPKSFYKL